MSTRLKERVALVTGASRGIGRAIALVFAREGADLIINYNNQVQKAKEVANQIEEMGRKAIVVRADVSIRDEVDEMVEVAISRFGRIDILVNNAGTIRRADIFNISMEDWNIPVRVNLNGTFNCTQAVIKNMSERKYGKIINIASNSGLGIDVPRMISYASSKGAVLTLTKVLAYELGKHDINVNCIAPGVVVTDITYDGRTKDEVKRYIEEKKRQSMLGRVGTPEDIANVALFLASDESRFITGQTIVADGGGTYYLTHGL